VCQLVEFFAGSRVDDYTPLLELVSRLAAPPFLTGAERLVTHTSAWRHAWCFLSAARWVLPAWVASLCYLCVISLVKCAMFPGCDPATSSPTPHQQQMRRRHRREPMMTCVGRC